jgi:hypothetical protein
MRKRSAYVAVVASSIIAGIVILNRPLLHVRPRGSDAGLEVQVSANAAQIGIPGVTKMYEGNLRNIGRFPVSIQVCDALTDAMYQEIRVAHAL